MELIPTTVTRWTDGDVYYSVSSGPAGPPSIQGIFLDGALMSSLKNAPGVAASSLKSSAATDTFLGKPEETKLSGAPGLRTTITVKAAPAPFQVVFAGHGGLLYVLVYSDTADSRDKDFLASFKFAG